MTKLRSSPLAASQFREGYVAKFERRIQFEPNSGCWLWDGAVSAKGYGRCGDSYRHSVAAHRVSYVLYRGDLDGKSWVLHRCDTPSCVNPEHLYLGDGQDNYDDMVLRNRCNKARGEKSGNTSLTSEQVALIASDTRIYRLIAADFGTSRTTVAKIKLGQTWGHINCSRVTNPVRRVLTLSDALKIRADSRPTKVVAADYGISASYCRDVRAGKRSWSSK